MKHTKIKDEDFGILIFKEIESITDLELLILKGHILVEYSMNKFIEDIADESFDIYKENFPFGQKTKICKALGLFRSTMHPLEEIITTLNKIRNSIAHYLEFDESELQKLISLYKKISHKVNPIQESGDNFEIVKELIQTICGRIIGIKMGKEKIEAYSHHILSTELRKDPKEFSEKFQKFKY